MCRYAFHHYKPHYACFKCRKTFKRRLAGDIRKGSLNNPAKCPQCGELMANMGLDFESPPKNDVKVWEHIKNLYQVGITFHSCGCTGPGYIPRDTERLIAYLQEILAKYHQHFNAFRERVEPQSKRERDRDVNKNWDIISQLPKEIKGKNYEVKNEDAKNYWIGKIKEVENKIQQVKNNN